jgi:serine/threonine-protein kinase
MDSTHPSAGEPPPRGAPWTGRTLAGKYRMGELIGEGGLSQVYAAIQLDLDREVAVKILDEDADADARERFLHETKIAAGIRHPCVAVIFDAGVDEDGQRYLVMERLKGETLARRIERGPFSATDAVGIVAGLCLALQAVHHEGFLHRDVKPSNVFLAKRPDGGADPKLIDFGIAKRVAVTDEVRRKVTTMRGLGSPATALDIIVGTPLYLSPEQIMGEPVDARTDVYALAVTLYEMLAGAPPFAGADLASLLGKIVMDDPAPLESAAPERAVPAALDREILRALSKDPAARPASAADFATALWTALAASRASSDPVPLAASAARDWRRIAVAVGVAAALALSLVALFQRRPPPPAPAEPPALPAATTPPPATPPPPPVPEQSASEPPGATANARRTSNGAPPGRATAAPARTAAPAPTAAPSAQSFRLDDLKPSPF